MKRVRRIAHASFDTQDIEQQVDYYTNVLGLTLVDKTKDAAYLASVLDHHSVVINKSDQASCKSLAFQVGVGELDEFQKQVESHGVEVTVQSDAQPTIGKQLLFKDPKGTEMVVFEEFEFTSQRFAEKGITPFKLGHVAFNVKGVKDIAKFYTDVLGFKESDWMGDFFAFLRCGPDHHTANFIDSPTNKFHHIAFELRDWAHVQQACDQLALAGIPIIWGPGRHGIGHNIFIYHRNPDGQIVELFCELDKMNDEELGYFEPRPWHSDRPQKPKVWEKNPFSANLWGIAPPDGFLD